MTKLISEYELRAIQAQVMVLNRRFGDISENATRTGHKRTRAKVEAEIMIKNLLSLLKTFQADPDTIREMVTQLEDTLSPSSVNEPLTKSTSDRVRACIVTSEKRIEENEFKLKRDRFRVILKEKNAAYTRCIKDLKIPENVRLLKEMNVKIQNILQDLEGHEGLKSKFEGLLRSVFYTLDEHEKNVKVLIKGTGTLPSTEVENRESTITTIQKFLLQASL